MYSIRKASLCLVVALAIAPLAAHAQGPPSGGGGSLNLVELANRVTALEANLAAERAARIAADTTLQTNINNEVNNRVGAVAAEISARAAADTTLQNNITAEFNDRVGAVAQEISDRVGAVAKEISDRQAGDTMLQGQIDKLKGNIVPGDLVGTYAVHFVATAMDGGPNQLTSYAITGTATLAADNTGFATLTAGGIAWTEGTPLQNWARDEVSGVIEFDFTWSYSNGTFSTLSESDFGNGSLNVVAGGQVMVNARGGAPSNNQVIIVWTRK